MNESTDKTIPQRTRIITLGLLSIVTTIIDQLSKVYAVHHWRGRPTQSFLGDIFRIEYAENHGAFLSLLADFPEEVRFWVLVVINGMVLVGLSIYLILGKKWHWSLFLPLALVVAGGIGNLIDRVRFGYVIDFFNLGLGNLRTGIFNVADMAITLGFILMLPMIIRGEPAESTAPQPAETPVEAAGS